MPLNTKDTAIDNIGEQTLEELQAWFDEERKKKKQHEDELKQLILKSDKPMAAFLGAGVSSASGIDGWNKVLEALAEETKDDELCKKVKLAIASNPASAASLIVSKYKEEMNLSREAINNKILEKFEQTVQHSTGSIAEVLEIFSFIITTNYDDCIENECANDVKGNEPYTHRVQSLDCLNPFDMFYLPIKQIQYLNRNKQLDVSNVKASVRKRFNSRTIVHIHGDKNSGEIVFTEEDYLLLYPSERDPKATPSKLEEYLSLLVTNVTLVFLGFSFRDIYFTRFLLKKLQRVKAESTVHSRLLSELSISQGTRALALPSQYALLSKVDRKDGKSLQILNSLSKAGIKFIIHNLPIHHNEYLNSVRSTTQGGISATEDLPGAKYI